MRRGRTLILVLLVVVIGLVVVFFAVRQIAAPPQNQPVYVDIYFAQQNIPQGAPITEAVLGTMTIPQENVVAVMYTVSERNDLLNNKVAKYPIDQGTPLTSSIVLDSNAAVPISGPTWASQIPPGMTAITVPANRLSLSAYAVNDGAHVNINACFLFVDVDPAFQTILPNLTSTLTSTGIITDQLPVLSLNASPAGTPQGRLELDPSVQQPYYLVPSEAQRPRPVCQTLLQDVLVMKLGNFSLTPSAAASTQPQVVQDQTQVAAPTVPDVITLIVSPQDSITLSYLIYSNAQLSFTLRNPSDQARQATEASTLQFLLSQFNIPVPAKLPYAMEPVVTQLVSPINDAVTVPPQ